MKKLVLSTITTAFVSSVAFAGSAKEIVPPPQPMPQGTWFAGASAGYLTDFEEPMYHLHFGYDFPARSAWQHSLFVEVGWTEGDDSTTFVTDGTGTIRNDLEILPVTLNYKIERQFANGFHMYAGAGAGVAFIDSSTKVNFPPGFTPSTASADDNDEVFVAQIFAGLGYDLNPDLEVYGGARWIYLDDDGSSAIGGAPGSQGFGALEDDVLIELGLRYNF